MLSLSHTFLLDFQVAAMISWACFAWSGGGITRPGRKQLSAVLRLHWFSASKQIAGAFLAGPGVYYFLCYLKEKPPGWKVQLGQLVAMALIALLAMVPWAVASYGFISEFAETNKKVIASTVGCYHCSTGSSKRCALLHFCAAWTNDTTAVGCFSPLPGFLRVENTFEIITGNA